MASNAIFGHNRGDSASVHQKQPFIHPTGGDSGRASPALANYDRYDRMNIRSEIELSQLGQSADCLPLLNEQGFAYPTDGQRPPSFPPPPSLPQYDYRPPGAQGVPQGPPPRFASPLPYQAPSEGFREAPLHRPYPPPRQGLSHTYTPSQESLAGRGAHRPY